MNALAGTRNDHGVSSATVWSVIGAPNVGGLSTAVMFSVKVSETLSEPSLAITLRSTVPLKSRGGVPENVQVVKSKASQDGSAVPLARVAV